MLDHLNREHDQKIASHIVGMHRYERPGQEGVPVSLDDMGADKDDDLATSSDKTTEVYDKFDKLLHQALLEDKDAVAAANSRRGVSPPLSTLLAAVVLLLFVHTHTNTHIRTPFLLPSAPRSPRL